VWQTAATLGSPGTREPGRGLADDIYQLMNPPQLS
jgi:hypothetical protein